MNKSVSFLNAYLVSAYIKHCFICGNIPEEFGKSWLINVAKENSILINHCLKESKASLGLIRFQSTSGNTEMSVHTFEIDACNIHSSRLEKLAKLALVDNTLSKEKIDKVIPPKLDEIKNVNKRLTKIVRDNYSDLSTWQEALQDTLKDMHDITARHLNID